MSTPGRLVTTTGALVRLGFADAEAAARALAGLALVATDPVVVALAGAADPDLALRGLTHLTDALAHDDRAVLLAALAEDDLLRRRLAAVLGGSEGLARHLARHPGDWRLLAGEHALTEAPGPLAVRRELLQAVGASAIEPLPWGSGGATARDDSTATLDALRVAYTRRVLTLAARDLTGELDVTAVAAELADLAAAGLEAGLAVAAAGLPPGSAPVRLAVVAMGKCGGGELNYVSDVDVVFVAEPLAGGDVDAALRSATLLATGMMRTCAESTREGQLFPVDAALRPEGKAGPLVRTLDSHLAYYRRWAQSWELQALLKARPVAGDLALGARWRTELQPLVWTTESRPDLPGEVQAMRRRVESLVSAGEREIKLGPGGLRDVEFAVQLLQLVHGRSDETLRSGTTLTALQSLCEGGYVGRADADELAAAYRWLRTVEHRLQLQRLRRTHTVPTDAADLRWLARALGLRSASELEGERRRHASVVRRLHEKVFYRPLLTAVARLPSDHARLDPGAVDERLAALGYADPAQARRHLAALTNGLSRRAAIQGQLLPVLLGWFADEADPDAGLLAFRRVSEALGDTPWYLRSLRDEGLVADRFAHLLARSAYVAHLLERAPEGLRILGDDAELAPRAAEGLVTELVSAVRRFEDPQRAVASARALRRHELLRTAAADLLGRLDRQQVQQSLTGVAAATVTAALDVALRSVRARNRGALPMRVALIGMGRLGGGEMGYASDADVIVVHERAGDASDAQASSGAFAVVEEARRLLSLPAPDEPLLLDAGLRPEGRQGPLSLTLAAYARYHSQRALVWERQALLRAAPLAGDVDLATRFLDQVADLRWPPGLGDDDLATVVRLRQRVADERAAPGLPRREAWRDVKLGRGGLADVEWAAQVLQLRHAHEVPSLRATGTVDVLEGAVAAGLLDPPTAGVLLAGWRAAATLRDAIVLATGRHVDVLPPPGRGLDGVGRIAGADLLAGWRDQARLVQEAAAGVLAG